MAEEKNQKTKSDFEWYQEFQKQFPIEQLQDMRLETYTNNKDETGFTWWLLNHFGGMGDRYNNKKFFGVYHPSKNPERTDFLNKYGKTLNEAFSDIKSRIYKTAELAQDFAINHRTEALQEIEKIKKLPPNYKWKIAFLYSNQVLIDWYNPDLLLKFVKTLKPQAQLSAQSKTFELQLKLIEIREKLYNGDKEKFNEDLLSIYNEINNNEDKTMTDTNNNASVLAKNLAKLLKNTKNIILHGAPGTGKTYLAKQIAQQMIFGDVKQKLSDEEKKTFNEQVELVQFHPSYDYTDFVEGIRPTPDGKFKLEDGIFKKFCEKALKNYLDCRKDGKILQEENDIKDLFSLLYDKIVNGETTEIKLREGAMDIVGINGKGTAIYLKTKNSNSDLKYTISLNRLTKLAERFKNLKEVDDIQNIYEAVTNAIKGCHSSGYWGALKTIYEIKESKNNTSLHSDEKADKKIEEKKFIFIIDEINRGELSKIFGELFFAIDPNYRGIEGKIRTQYANMQDTDDMQDEQNLFDTALGIDDSEEKNKGSFGNFFVPENVYIIGTMNDIDRSVESMDFAMRRRFTFKEIKAENNTEMLNQLGDKAEEARTRMQSLNNAIKDFPGLSSAYHIGAAYFLKLKDLDNNFNKLWEYHLEPLLREYLRGQGDVDKKIEELHKAYESK